MRICRAICSCAIDVACIFFVLAPDLGQVGSGVVLLTALTACASHARRAHCVRHDSTHRYKRMKAFFLSEKNGVFGALYKASVIGTRLHWAVSLACITMGAYILIL